MESVTWQIIPVFPSPAFPAWLPYRGFRMESQCGILVIYNIIKWLCNNFRVESVASRNEGFIHPLTPLALKLRTKGSRFQGSVFGVWRYLRIDSSSLEPCTLSLEPVFYLDIAITSYCKNRPVEIFLYLSFQEIWKNSFVISDRANAKIAIFGFALTWDGQDL